MNIEEQYDKIYRFCYYRVNNREKAEDLTQETFLRYMNSGVEARGQEIRYLYRIAGNLCIDESRRKETEEISEDVPDATGDPDGMIDDLHVRQILSGLDAEDRELLVLRYMNGESVTDICRIMGISRFALYRRLEQAKRRFLKLY